MGRSVSVPSDAFAVAYRDVSSFGYQTEDEDGNKIENPEYDETLGSMDWDDFVDNLKADAQKAFPSLEEADKWVGREDHAILANRFAYFGISEYCGLASVWLVLRDDLDSSGWGVDLTSLANRWADQVKAKFEKQFGELRKVGTFSNGEGVYERKSAE